MRLVINFIFVTAAKIWVQYKQEGEMWDKEWEKGKDTVIPFSSSVTSYIRQDLRWEESFEALNSNNWTRHIAVSSVN